MNNLVVLPTWLDEYLFNKLSAKFGKKCKNLVVLHWNADDILCYLGTYFPRSFTESYCIFKQYLNNNPSQYSLKDEIIIFDFGCGTGGELIGLLIALNECRNNVKKVIIHALDGNNCALHNLEHILSESQKYVSFEIIHEVIPFEIDDFYDLSLVESFCLKNKQYDIILSFKAICEFVTKQQLEEQNPYEHLIKTFLPHLLKNGIMCIADISSYSDVAQSWLPLIIDEGIKATSMDVIARNKNYNETYYVTHSHKQNDTSKIVWRILKSNES